MTTIKIEQGELAAAVVFAARALPKSATTPAILGIRLVAEDKKLTVSAFDFETFASANATVNGGKMDVLVPGAVLARYVNALPKDQVSIDLDGEALRLTSGKAKVTLRILRNDSYPTGPAAPPALGTLDAHALASAMAHVRQCIDPAIGMQVMRGIFMEASTKAGLSVVGLDGTHLAKRVVAFKGKSHEYVSVPPHLADAAKSMDGTISLGLSDSLIAFVSEDRSIIGRLIAGDTPKIEATLARAEPKVHVTVNRTDLIDTVKFAALGAPTKDARSVQMEITADSLAVSLANTDSHDALSVIAAAVEGDPFDLEVDPTKLLHALDVTEAEVVTLHLQSTRLPMIVTAESDPDAKAMCAPKITPKAR